MAKADGEKASITEEKPNPIPLFLGIGIIIVVIFLYMKSRRPATPLPQQDPALPQKDPCEGIPDWACGAVQLLNPVSQASVDIYRAQAQADVQKAQLKAAQRY